MKFCPNPECPYALRHHEAGEYRDEAAACSDCGAELTTVHPLSTPVMANPGGPRVESLALTLLAPLLVVWLAPKVPLPGLDMGRIESALGGLASRTLFSVFALGLGPMVSASLLVELAALWVPRWRSFRIGGPSGRGQLLRATGRLALALAIVQALGVAVYMERLGALKGDVRFSRLVVVLTLVAGTAALVALAQLLDRAALGGGFSLLLTAFALPSLVPFGTEAWRALTVPSHGSAGQARLAGGALLLACAGTVFFLRWRPLDADGRRSTTLPLPACGVIPLTWAAAPAILALRLRAEGLYPAEFFSSWQVSSAVVLTLSAGFAVGLSFLFNRPSKVAAFGPDAQGRVLRAATYSVAYVLGLGVLGWFISHQLRSEPDFEPVPRFEPESLTGLIPLVMVVAVVLDVIAEATAVRRHGELVAVWPEHRLYAVEDARQALDRRGIPSLARSVHQRVLWHFLAPLIPVQIMVPQQRAEEAGQVLLEYFRTTSAAPRASEEIEGGDA